MGCCFGVGFCSGMCSCSKMGCCFGGPGFGGGGRLILGFLGGSCIGVGFCSKVGSVGRSWTAEGFCSRASE